MKDILFKGKTFNGEWVYGWVTTQFKKHTDGELLTKIQSNTFGVGEHQVQTETVGEYTGLKDKNGVKIFEGDIVKGQSLYKYGGFEYLGVVRWGNQNYLIGWLVSNASGDWDLRACSAKISLDNITGEIIGNIYDNPELLKEYEV